MLADAMDAPRVRRANLHAYLEAMCGAKAIWFGRDLGYRGGRRTGIALTDEHHLSHASLRLRGLALRRATSGVPVRERTAAIVWDLIGRLPDVPFLWNVFPFHPHEPSFPLSNRCHTRREREACSAILSAILEYVCPSTIIAVGRDAFEALTALDLKPHAVRHPSYGGQTEFREGIYRLHRMRPSQVA